MEGMESFGKLEGEGFASGTPPFRLLGLSEMQGLGPYRSQITNSKGLL